MIKVVKSRFISAIDREYTSMMKEPHSAEDIKIIHNINRKIKDMIASL